jgi:hypothetical protein
VRPRRKPSKQHAARPQIQRNGTGKAIDQIVSIVPVSHSQILEYLRTCDLDHASRPRNDRESEAVQLHNRGDQAQTKTQA